MSALLGLYAVAIFSFVLGWHCCAKARDKADAEQRLQDIERRLAAARRAAARFSREGREHA